MTALFERDGALRWLVWLAVGAGLHLLLIVMQWVLFRDIEVSLLNPWTYSDWGWLLTVAWYCGCVWMWAIE